MFWCSAAKWLDLAKQRAHLEAFGPQIRALREQVAAEDTARTQESRGTVKGTGGGCACAG